MRRTQTVPAVVGTMLMLMLQEDVALLQVVITVSCTKLQVCAGEFQAKPSASRKRKTSFFIKASDTDLYGVTPTPALAKAKDFPIFRAVSLTGEKAGNS